jgi:hypothetical protein
VEASRDGRAGGDVRHRLAAFNHPTASAEAITASFVGSPHERRGWSSRRRWSALAGGLRRVGHHPDARQPVFDGRYERRVIVGPALMVGIGWQRSM